MSCEEYRKKIHYILFQYLPIKRDIRYHFPVNWITYFLALKFQMFCLLTCALLYLTLSNAQTPYGATPLPTPFSRPTPSTYPTTLPTTVSSLAPTVPLPFGPNHRPFGPSFNHAYYDPAAGPAVPILTYSSEHVGDGTYSYR